MDVPSSHLRNLHAIYEHFKTMPMLVSVMALLLPGKSKMSLFRRTISFYP